MTLEHVAIWTNRLEQLKDFYATYFGGLPGEKYTNEKKQFSSYFLSFASGARLEIMTRPDLPANSNDPVKTPCVGIIHLAFGVDSLKEVDNKAAQLQKNGYPILSGPRRTGDGYYEFETLDPDNNLLEVSAKYIQVNINKE